MESSLVLRELSEVALCEHTLDVGLMGWIDDGDAGTLEACAGETTTIDTR